MIVPVILSGGSGSRLWPLSREYYPKQLLPLVGQRTMLQDTVLRLDCLNDRGAPLVVCNEAHRFMVAEQLRQVGQEAEAVILEPVGRNTAPAVALAALQALSQGGDPVLLILPADHVIRNAQALCLAIQAGLKPVSSGCLLTFGIIPNAPETGYGYIRRGPHLENGDHGTNEIYEVDRFVEKPDLETAQTYLAEGGYYWNSGMFMFKASVYLEELETFAPDILAACKNAWENRVRDLDFTRLDPEMFGKCPSDSIDYAVMEKTGRGVVIPLDAGWSDVGSWAALWGVGETDSLGNVTYGDVIDVDCHESYLYGGSRLVAGVGLKNTIVVETADAVLVADKDRVQDVKQIVEHLKSSHREEHLLHKRVNRPWGSYEGLDAGDGFLVKRITVNPGASLSLQRHQHRAEHWVVVRGTADVTCDNVVQSLVANQSFYIPIGSMHRLTNPGDEMLEIIEVQTGEWLSEDDIERFEDNYGR